jgi:CubicO group peptidase (beta-lactamase class C family)
MRSGALLPRLAILTTVGLLPACATSVRPAALPVTPSARVHAVPALLPAAPREVGMDSRLGATLDSLVTAALADGAAPGAALAVGRHGRLVHIEAYGRIDGAADAAAVTDSTRFDMASVTKIAAGTIAAMLLEEQGLLDLDRPVSAYLPELRAPEKAAITVRQLLTHRGGFEAFAALFREVTGRAAYLERIDARPLAYSPGDSSIYSDWDLVLTGLIIERLVGRPLDVFLRERVYGPLGMRDTGYNPLAAGPLPADADCTAAYRADHPLLSLIAKTEVDTVYRRMHVHGIVHDENACALGGVAGHAGLFSSARDLAILAQMLLNGGEYAGVRLLRPATIARWSARQTPRSSRAIGFDTPSPGSSAGRYFSSRSFGHTGFTGTSMWIDPERGLFVVLLTNRVNPTRANTKHEPLRRAVADAVQRAVLDAPLQEWQRRP